MPREIRVGRVKLGAAERANIIKVMASNQVSPGPFVDEFERKFAFKHGSEYGVMMNSGTDALRIALLALKEKYQWPEGSHVIVPALTFVATVNIILQCGLNPYFVDVSPDDLNIDVQKLSKELFWAVKAVIPVHLFGNPCDMKTITQLTEAAGVRVIEDSCESMGVNAPDHPVGSYGDIGCFSTYACHLIQTGVGGIAITRSEDLNDLMRSYMNHGRRSEDHKDRFVFDRIGYSSRPTEFEAAIGLGQLETLSESITVRRHNAELMSDLLETYTDDIWTSRSSSNHAWMMYPIVLQKQGIRDQFTAYLESQGVETRPLFPLLTQPCYKNLSDKAEKFPVALSAMENGFYVGCHDGMTEDDVAYTAEVISNAIEKFSLKEDQVAVA